MNREVHVPFCERLRGKFPLSTHHQLHWVLDMSFGEDQSRIRKDNAPTNVAIIRHAALNMIRQAQKKRTSIKLMRKAAGWNNAVLKDILEQVF
ncbi:hypothetical protein [Methylobacter sp. YRD-M1]|uniref:hypothetical protein n=1 Tax=Methylobacter sp. YRD-M1 TaxID=2911520 RepID=UPI00227A9668|nr:hypothetical protein [Methylobacter sp. YRD-M1]WAK04438.1 hypothetical protein LZ558_20855 [Methylobacter sp. YRD-M1]